MPRHAALQPDLFAPAAAPLPAVRRADEAIAELRAIVAHLRAATVLPWAGVPEAMAAEHHMMALGRDGGVEGEALVAAAFVETERLFSAQERAHLGQG